MSQHLRPPLLQRLRPWHWVVLDLLVAAVFTVALAGGDIGAPPSSDGRGGEAGQALLAATLLLAGLRRLWPVGIATAVQLGACAGAALGVGTSGLLATAYAVYLLPLHLSRRRSALALGLILTTTVVGIAIGPPQPGGADTPIDIRTVALGTVIAAAWAIGEAVRQQRAYAAGLQEQARREARALVAEERLRIARELHDVVAHGMSLIAVQAGVANHVVAQQPQEAARALSSIEATSRQALREMRRLLGVLRDADGGRDGPELAPAPGLADLPELVERTRRAGIQVDIEANGDIVDLPPGIELTGYRIVQEALTNVVRHSGADRCRVVVVREPDALHIDVTDNGSGLGDPDQPERGAGIAGMRERVGLYGGELHVGPQPEGGYRVTARIPVGTVS